MFVAHSEWAGRLECLRGADGLMGTHILRSAGPLRQVYSSADVEDHLMISNGARLPGQERAQLRDLRPGAFGCGRDSDGRFQEQEILIKNFVSASGRRRVIISKAGKLKSIPTAAPVPPNKKC